MNEKDERHVESALNHLDVLKSYLVRGDLDDPVLFDAVCLRLGASIEVAAKLSEEARERAFGSTWKAIWSTRNRIAHAYEYIDPQLIRSTVEKDLVEYEGALRGLLQPGADSR
ncbi:DUF86 domain-containing protein [Promicromonospora thailandica]|uniref:Conserved protein, contains HEPN domain n=1 Tax=Promicromonospora thailandica TaxID=765201 RepID=A0A9X2FXK7_9MICO|nr:HepT-like ribonuclease domain-containing protein [Promicromonospora thailandica]MCP2263200.1 putative conserved protein, contains HEPN domain [Promicromonospora thailandica]BFF18587.1 hypothetical protein GCM10025730_21080 [Promicromonospora thailandica]